MKICIVGMGYIGVSLALTLAEKHKIIGIEKDEGKLKALRNKECYVQTNDIRDGKMIPAQEYLNKYTENGMLTFTDSISGGMKDADAVIVAVNCMPSEDNLHIHDEVLKAVTSEIGKNLRKGQLVGIMTTVPPGETNKVLKPILEKNSKLVAGKDFYLANVPEWISEQQDSLYQFRTIPRLIGGITKECTEKWAGVFDFLPCEIVKMSCPEVAELAKLFENTYLFINLAYSNECGMIAEALGADGFEAIAAANKLTKVHMFYPGVWGGSCLPKDYRLLMIACREQTGFIPHLIMSGRNIFYETNEQVVRKIRAKFNPEKTIGILGVAFKPKTDDTRNSPALYIINKLREKGYSKFLVYDPMATDGVNAKFANEVWEKSDCVVVCCGWDEFKTLDLNKAKFVIDACGLFRKEFRKNLVKIGCGKNSS